MCVTRTMLRVVPLAASVAIAAVLTASPAMAQDKPLMAKWLDGELPYEGPEITYDGPPITIRHSHFIPRSAAINGDQHIKFGKLLEKRSNGKLKFRVYWQNSLSDAQRGAFEAVASGVADSSQCYPLFAPSRFDLWAGIQLPSLIDEGTRAARGLEELYPQFLKEEYEAQGVYLVRVDTTPPNYILTREAQVTKPSDVAGRKLWAIGDVASRIAKALNATAAQIPPSDMYVAYQTGVFDVMQMHDAGSILFRMAELSRFRTAVGLSANPVPSCINQRFFNDLPADLKELYYRYVQMFNQVEGELFFDKFAADARKKMEKMGIKSYAPKGDEKAAWDKALAPVEAGWVEEMEAKGKPARAMLAAFKARKAELDLMTRDQVAELAWKKPVPNLISGYTLPSR